MQENTYCWKFSGGTAEISVEELRGLLEQLEAELRHSNLYQQILASLQGLPEDLSDRVQKMVNAIGKAGVQLALRKLLTKKVEPTPAPDAPSSASQITHVTPTPPVPTRPSSLTEPRRFKTAIAAKQSAPQPPKRPSKKELAAQATLEVWRDRLREIGQTLQQARQAQSLSLYHLHFKTQIPLHRLESLEAGNVEQLTEDDIYIRGFIRRVGDVLGLDGTALANSLPVLDVTRLVLPSWQRSSRKAGNLQLGTVHLYVGYAALLAGGISWLSHQTHISQIKPLTTIESLPVTPTVPDASKGTPPSATDATRSPANGKNTSKIKSFAHKEITNLNNIAPPETTNGLESRSIR